MQYILGGCKSNGLIAEDVKWYKEKWETGKVLENKKGKVLWDFQFKLLKTEKSRRPDLILEDYDEKYIYIVDMAVPMEVNVEKKKRSKLTKYQQLAYEIRMRRPGFKVYIIPLIIGGCGRGAESTLLELKKYFPATISNAILKEMVKTVVIHSESIIRKVVSGLIQT